MRVGGTTMTTMSTETGEGGTGGMESDKGEEKKGHDVVT
jgi:hypothetical protein